MYHYIVAPRSAHGLLTYVYGIYRGKVLVHWSEHMSAETCEREARRITYKMNQFQEVAA